MAISLIHASAPAHFTCPVQDESQVGAARRRARQVAEACLLDGVSREQVAIVATELSTNMLKHARGGELLIQQIADESFDGIELLAVDRGPGIPDVERALEDGHSTRGTPGTGLGAARRLSAQFDVFSETGGGTVVLSRIGTTLGTRPGMRVGAVASTAPGETVSGDQWAMSLRLNECSVMMADGLGHGVKAYEAAVAAVQVFTDHEGIQPVDYLTRTHDALKSTRGAAVAMATFALESESLTFAGVGNIAGVIVRADGKQHGLVSNNGTAGAEMPTVREFRYDWRVGDTLVMHSDGMRTRWNLDGRRALMRCHPAVIAAVLHRDYRRGRDDATVVVMTR